MTACHHLPGSGRRERTSFMRERLRLAVLVLAIAALLPGVGLAQERGEAGISAPAAPAVLIVPGTSGYVTGGGWRVDLSADSPAVSQARMLALPSVLPPVVQDPAPQRPRPVAFEYSDAYHTRRKIHVYASLAMLPLFVTQFALGDSLYTDATEGKRTAHVIVGSSIGVLFGVNTVTGAWNLWEGRKDPTRRGRRLTHGLLMLAADAGFVATGLLAPGDDGEGNRSAHRAVAITSMSVATASYLFMLLTK
jgi:hypothetical protein